MGDFAARFFDEGRCLYLSYAYRIKAISLRDNILAVGKLKFTNDQEVGTVDVGP